MFRNDVTMSQKKRLTVCTKNCSVTQMDSDKVYILLHLIIPYITDIRSLVHVHSLRELQIDKFEYPIEEYLSKRATFKKWKHYKGPNCFRLNSWRKRVVNRDDVPILIM